MTMNIGDIESINITIEPRGPRDRFHKVTISILDKHNNPPSTMRALFGSQAIGTGDVLSSLKQFINALEAEGATNTERK